MILAKRLPLYDIHQAAFLQFKGSPLTLTREGSRVVFEVPATEETYKMLRGYQGNPSIPLLDYVAVLRRLRARMLEARTETEKGNGRREMDILQSSLHLEHLKDLRGSGLTDETIHAAGIYSVPPRDISKMLEGHFPKVESLLSFPYPGADGYERVKLFPPQRTDKGTVKYYQKAGSPCHAYFPLGVEAILQDVSSPLYVTEGEKKSLKAIQEGIPCIGLGGFGTGQTGPRIKTSFPILTEST